MHVLLVEVEIVIDRVELQIKAGDGGDGAISFRREKFIPYGGPYGGDGGRGGSVYIVGDSQLTVLQHLGRRKQWRAPNGGNGTSKKRRGLNGQDLMIRVPLGTEIFKRTNSNDVSIGDIVEDGQTVMVAKGGRGGFGNAHFTSSTNQAPRIAQRGEKGEEALVELNLKLIADVGIVGLPNVGKSTLLAAASAARPKIAAYPFTTREPVLGVVVSGKISFILAEIPGLIERAHMGAGLGHQFLRHAERTRLLIHLLDGSSTDPVSDLDTVNRELALYSPSLSQRPQIVAVNKIDIDDVRAGAPKLTKRLASRGIAALFISAATGEGVQQLMVAVAEMLQNVPIEEPKAPTPVFRPAPRREAITVSREGNTFVVASARAEGLVSRMDVTSAEVRSYLRRRLARMGVIRALTQAGAKPGDIVRFGKVEMEWD